MGSKLDPGSFDCHDAALPDEEQFTLLARDPLAPFLVSIWASMRTGDFEAAETQFKIMQIRLGRKYAAEPDVDKAFEARDCAMRMFAWRQANDGAWRE